MGLDACYNLVVAQQPTKMHVTTCIKKTLSNGLDQDMQWIDYT